MNYIPVSLGQTAEARYQIVRSLFARFQPDQPYDVMRWAVFAPDQASFVYPQGIFDLQITQPHAVCDYIQSDFRGIFEKEDLHLTDNSLEVQNTRFQTTHPNLFPKKGEVLTQAEFEAGYETARAKIESLADAFRKALAAPEPRLYILSEAPTPEELATLFDTLASHAAHPFHILVHTRSPEMYERLTPLPNLDLFLADHKINKPAAHQWEGDDAVWDRALSRYDFAEVLRPR
jgi:hypothetical protein